MTKRLKVGDRCRTTRNTGNVRAGVDCIVADVLPNGVLLATTDPREARDLADAPL